MTKTSPETSGPDPQSAAALAVELRELLVEQFLETADERFEYRQDTWVRSMLRDHQGRGAEGPWAVALPGSTEEMSAVLGAARRHGVSVVPRGAGSGVVGGVLAGSADLVVSTERLSGLASFSDIDSIAVFGAGTNGMDAEMMMQEKGFTIGHWPQSIALSSVGGWVATRASGQLSTANGNIEDIVVGLTAVLADATVVRSGDTPRAASGPDIRQMLLGSEGTLGIITEVAVMVRPLPTERAFRYLHFPTFGAGLEAIRRMMQGGSAPAVVRLYDEIETARHFEGAGPDGSAGLILAFEGGSRLSEDVAMAETLLLGDSGAPGDHEVASTWFADKSHAPSAAPFLEHNIVVDTIEIAAPWSKIAAVYREVIARVSAVPDVLAVSGHSSHSYRTGTNIYFSFGVRPADPAGLEAAYDAVWAATMEATIGAGGGISHHHGIGRVRRGWLRDEVGDGGMALLRILKDGLDPDGRFNPGVLL